MWAFQMKRIQLLEEAYDKVGLQDLENDVRRKEGKREKC
jgi:hypothetical protein